MTDTPVLPSGSLAANTTPVNATPARVRLGQFGLVTTVVATLIVGLLHVIPPTAGISPTQRTISEYQLSDVAWVFNAAIVLLALGSAAIFAAAALTPTPRKRSRFAGVVLGGVWVVGMLAIAGFTKTDWSVGPSVTGTVHRWASIAAFVALPAAIPLLVRAIRPAGMAGRIAAVLAVVAPLWLLWIVGAMVVNTTGRWWAVVPLGVVERGLALTEVLALMFLAVHLLRRTADR